MIEFEQCVSRYSISKMPDNMIVENFDCNDEDLNDFIINDAINFKQQLISMPYILCERGNPQSVVAYFTLSNDKIAVTDFQNNNQFNKFKKKNFPREKYLRSYPSVKIGRLAVSKDFCRQGIGTHLIRFIKMFFLFENKTGCRFITVDAYNAAVTFYEQNGFVFLQQKDEQPTQLMFFDLMTVNKVGL